MGFRFRRSFKIAPGFRLNASKSGLSGSVGGPTIGPRGTRSTVGLPGTGLSYTQQSRGRGAFWLLLIVVLGVIVLFTFR